MSAQSDRILTATFAEPVWTQEPDELGNIAAAMIGNSMMLDLIERHEARHKATLAEFEQRRRMRAEGEVL